MSNHLKNNGKEIRIHYGLIGGLFGTLLILQAVFSGMQQHLWAAEALPSNFRLAETISNTIESELAGLKDLKLRLGRLKEFHKTLTSELNVYQLQNTALGNVAVQPQVRLDDLENALSQANVAIANLDTRIKEIKERQEKLSELSRQNANQFQLSQDEMRVLKEDPQISSKSEGYLRSLKKLIDIFKEKQHILDALEALRKEEADKSAEIYNKLTALKTRLETGIREKKKQELFQRSGSMLSIVKGKIFIEEVYALQQRVREKISPAYWGKELTAIKEAGAVALTSSLFLLLFTLFFLNRLRHYCLNAEKAIDITLHPYRYLAIRLLRRSAIVLGLAGFLYLSDLVLLRSLEGPSVDLLLEFIFIWIFYRWALDFLYFWKARAPNWFPTWLIERLRRFVRFTGWVALAYVALFAAMGASIAFLFLFRLGLSVGLAVWWVRFWNALDSYYENELQALQETWFKKIVMARLLSFGIVFSGLFAALFGFGSLALYWYTSWIKSLVVTMWAIIFYHLIREWRISTKSAKKTALEGTSNGPYSWLVYQMLRLVWLFWVIVTILIAWGDGQRVFKIANSVLTYSFAIGKIRLTLLSIIYALLAVFATHIVVQIGRYILKEKILNEGNLERGLEDSITTITTYLLWGLGLVIALSVLGVSTTSLAVVFGALSIGIGFGLQNIFNNFISGLILLLERPIQIGDAVEVGGIWGEVRKINVRSTVVQTYDNASLIIPNSEFISQQVTNWSFKDQRIRRQLKIGVAYGSDVDLVRDTLLEIIANTPNVRKYPAPDVLFWEHGDSALIFNLRFWTEIDRFITTESNIRFEITRLFNARKIEIAFPQLDVHLHNQSSESAQGLEKK